MGILSAFRIASPNLEAASLSPDVSPVIPLAYGGEGSLLALRALSISRSDALRVPEIKRSRDLIASTIAAAGIYLEDRNGVRDESLSFIKQPDPTLIRSTMIAATVSDLFFDGVSVWHIDSRYVQTGKPFTASRVPADQVQITTDSMNRISEVWIMGAQVPVADCIIFRHSCEGILTTGRDTILTSLSIEGAIRSAMNLPLPTLNVSYSGVKLTNEQTDELMAYYDSVIRERSTVFTDKDVKLEPIGWNPEQLALAALRQAQATAVSRLTGVPAWYLSAESGTSMTYSNNTMARQDLYSLALMPYIRTIEETLSQNTITAQGSEVHFDFSDFLQADPKARADIYNTLIPLGVMTVQEARVMEGFVEEPSA